MASPKMSTHGFGHMITYNLHGLILKSNVHICSSHYLVEDYLSSEGDIHVYVGNFPTPKEIVSENETFFWRPRLVLRNLSSKPSIIYYKPHIRSRFGRKFRKLFSEILKLKFLEMDKTLLHSACVVNGQNAILIIAPAETGKTLTTLRLLKQGYHFLSDDYLLTDGSSVFSMINGLTIHSYHADFLKFSQIKKLEVKIRDFISYLPIISLVIGEYKLRASELSKFIKNVKIIDKAKISKLVFLEYGPEGILEIDTEEALRRLKVIGNAHIHPWENEILLQYAYYFNYPDFEKMRAKEYEIYKRVINSSEGIYLIRSRERNFSKLIPKIEKY